MDNLDFELGNRYFLGNVDDLVVEEFYRSRLKMTMQKLLSEIMGCEYCKEHLPLGPRPMITGTSKSKIVLVSQAPCRKAH